MSQIKALLKKLADISHIKSYLQLQFDFIARNVHKTRKKKNFHRRNVQQKKEEEEKKMFLCLITDLVEIW